jgi:hypothetical protein
MHVRLSPALAPPRRRRWPVVLAFGALLAGLVGSFLLPAAPTSATPSTSGGWTTNASASPASARRGQAVTLTVTATSTSTRRALVDLEVYGASGAKVFQQAWDNQAFTAGAPRSFTTTWTVPGSEAVGAHTVKVGIFSPGWGQLYHWNNAGASFAVAATTGTTTTTTTTTTTPTATTTTRPPSTTTTTRPPTTTTTAPAAGHFATLPAGSPLPTDAQCTALVRPAGEVRPDNATPNHTKGFGPPSNPPAGVYSRVTGNFTGTTDEILQWASCKWGIDEDIVRAQTAKESWWHQSTVGDNGESFGLMQVRQPYWMWAFNGGNGDAKTSSAFNMDVALAGRRNCLEGNDTWLGGSYAKGDVWGCVGLWFSGRWHDPPAEQYIAAVKDYLNQRIWTTPDFLAG